MKNTSTYKKRFGDRREGRRLRSLEPITQVIPFLMKTRTESMNTFVTSVEITELLKYVHNLRDQGYKGINAMHILVAAYARTVSEYPGINRFISGQRIFARKDIQISMAVKKELKLNAPETMLKFYLTPGSNLFDVYNEMNSKIEEYKTQEEDDSFDKLVRVLAFFPRFVFRFAVKMLFLMDYYDWIPMFLLKLSPFHCSLLITSMGSLGVPPIYHHLYNFGNAPMFVSFGTTRNECELEADGTVIQRRYMDFKVTMDERICDGQYFSAAVHALIKYLKNPKLLEISPETVNEDVR